MNITKRQCGQSGGKDIRMSIYEHTIKDIKGNEGTLEGYKGKVLLIVNTATGCGFTPQYDGLQDLYEKYHDQGFEILDFPCNQFAEQAPGTEEEIESFCNARFGITFPQFSKIEVNGENANPIFVELATALPFQGFSGLRGVAMKAPQKMIDKTFGDKAYIKWNFTKFLVDREGNAIARFEPTTEPKDIESAIEKLL